MKHPRRPSVYFIKSLVISIFIQFSNFTTPKPSAPLDIRPCIRKSRGYTVAALYTGKFLQAVTRILYPRSVLVANQFAFPTDRPCFSTDQNSLSITSDFYRSGEKTRLGSRQSLKMRFFGISSGNGLRDRRVLKIKRAVYTSAVHGDDFVKDPRIVGFSSETMITGDTSCPVFQSECQDRLRRSNGKENALAVRNKTRSWLVWPVPLSTRHRDPRTCARHVS